MDTIQINNLSYSLDGKDILKDISLAIDGNSCVGIIGPNGSGKSTLLKHLYRVHQLQTGSIHFDGRPIQDIPLRETAQTVGVMAQFTKLDFDFTVFEMALMGRAPYKKAFEQDTREDYELVEKVLVEVGMWEARDRLFNSLSGGEQQRVVLARTLVQEPKLLILDEPTNHLDIHYQMKLLQIVKGLGVGVIAALHDINLAAAFCDIIGVMHEGCLVTIGPPKEVITAELLHHIYGVEAEVHLTLHGRPQVTYQLDSLMRDGGRFA